MSDAPKCPPCKAGAPAWMASFADMCTLLLTFFVLLLSFAKTETARFEAALGSIRNAFGGNVLKEGQVMQLGKSPDDSMTMIESQNPPRPFPIEFLTAEGLLDKQEINRESDEQLKEIKNFLKDYDLAQDVNVQEMPESIQVRLKDKIIFTKGSISVQEINSEVFENLIQLMRDKNWNLMIEGHAEKNEVGANGADAFTLSSQRASAVGRMLMQRGVSPERLTIIFYGDSRPQQNPENNPYIIDRRVDFFLKKADFRREGKIK